MSRPKMLDHFGRTCFNLNWLQCNARKWEWSEVSETMTLLGISLLTPLPNKNADCHWLTGLPEIDKWSLTFFPLERSRIAWQTDIRLWDVEEICIWTWSRKPNRLQNAWYEHSCQSNQTISTRSPWSVMNRLRYWSETGSTLTQAGSFHCWIIFSLMWSNEIKKGSDNKVITWTVRTSNQVDFVWEDCHWCSWRTEVAVLSSRIEFPGICLTENWVGSLICYLDGWCSL